MQTRELRQVEFDVQPIKNIVGVGGGTAFHIVVTPRGQAATLGIVTIPAYAEVCNDRRFARNIVEESGSSQALSWIKRVLATLKS